MALSHYLTYAGGVTGAQPSLVMDPSIAPFNASVGVVLASTGTYGLQFSLDPIDVSDAISVWFDDTNIPAGSTSTKVTNYMFPVSKVRVNIVANATGLSIKTLQGYTKN